MRLIILVISTLIILTLGYLALDASTSSWLHRLGSITDFQVRIERFIIVTGTSALIYLFYLAIWPKDFSEIEKPHIALALFVMGLYGFWFASMTKSLN
jgi:hypothetical protein